MTEVRRKTKDLIKDAARKNETYAHILKKIPVEQSQGNSRKLTMR